MKWNIKRKLSFFVFCLIGLNAFSQGTLTDYRRAEAVDSLFANKVYNAPESFHWLDAKHFWYKNVDSEGISYLIVDTESKSQKPIFDTEKLTKSLNKWLKKDKNREGLDMNDLKYNEDRSRLNFRIDSLKFQLNLTDYHVEVTDTIPQKKDGDSYWGNRNREKEGKPVISPDSAFTAYVESNNIFVRDNKTDQSAQLSYDGVLGDAYNSHLLWSPDSKKIMGYKVKPGAKHEIYFVESSPDDQLQPKLQTRNYLKPGDELDFKSPQIFDIEKKKHIPVSTALFDAQYSIQNFKWNDDSSNFTFEYNQRGHQVYRVLKVDAKTGKVQAIIDESSPTFIDYSGKKYRHDVEGKNEIIWASERDGYSHLYLYDAETGKVKNQITSGEWPVREVLEVDDKNRQIYFTASGMDKRMDPYFIQYCRIDFDGSNFTRFTTENGNHKVTFSPDHAYYVDQYSRVDLPAVTVLKETEKKKAVMELQIADISALEKTGWQMPEVFMAKGRDNATEIWGMIVRPSTFDPSKTYPIIEYIYAGPHDSFVPKDFHAKYWAMTALAELGFIVVQIDGMGTSNRSKKFQDVCWQNLKDAGFPDRKLWIKAAAKKYPYMNADKVGIHGTSAGGQSAGAALVFNSDFYDVAVASCGCHDNRMDKMWWNEQWMGYPIGPQYEASSNIVHASQLQGNIMLIVGEVDDNVDPASTMQFADALIKANKDFELVVLPGENHTSGGQFGERKRRDFFVKHLLGVNPPSWGKIYK